ncbi:DNA polymerase III subunit gamma/tau [Candidatus Uhrbacteria bacterium]|nr:DNA polymerase III subunit gamma/tau [Candidatus Uhrbacteria bacterium]
MSTTLYREYRPQTFSDLTGQNHIKVTLQNEIALKRVAHAYLFTGPRGTGKTTTARLLAKAINCENRKEAESEPCNVCEACLSIIQNRALDVIEIDAASHTGVDNVRENIIENVRFTPTRLKNKVFIIDEVHMLSASAWNALLKTLEEPPDRVVMILATTEVAKIPATIISRCQRFDFHRISVESLVERLQKLADAEKVAVDREVLYSIARHADGGLRDAEGMLGQVIALGEEKITVEVASIVLPHSSFEAVLSFMDQMARRASREALSSISRLTEEGVDARLFLDELIEFSRKLLLTKFSGSLQEFSVGFDTEFADRILGYGKSFETADLIRLLQLLLEAREGAGRAKIAQLPLEMAVVDFCEPIAASNNAGVSFSKTEQERLTVNDKKEDKLIKEEGGEKLKENNIPAAAPAPQEEKTKEQEPKADSLEDAGVIRLEKALELWPEFIKRAQIESHSLRVLLGVGRPLNVLGDKLQIGVKYKLHAERLNDIKNRMILERIFLEIFGVPVRIEGVVAEDAPVEASADPMIKKALETFGGRVVG